MAGIVCESQTQNPGTLDFTLTLPGPVVYDCAAETAPILLVEQGGLNKAEFDELWPLLLLMVVTSYGLYMVRRMFA